MESGPEAHGPGGRGAVSSSPPQAWVCSGAGPHMWFPLDGMAHFKLLLLCLMSGAQSCHRGLSFYILVGSDDLTRGTAGCEEPLETIREGCHDKGF